MSSTGIPSVMQKIVAIPAWAASITASGAPAAGTKISDVFAPVSGTIVERNAALEEHPELVNEHPYGDGWLVAIDPADPADVDALLDAAAYQEHISSS